MNRAIIPWETLFDKNGNVQVKDGDFCLIFDECAKSNIHGLYLGKCDIKKSRWLGFGVNSYLPFSTSHHAVCLGDISGFTRLSECKQMPPEHDIYLVKRYLPYENSRFHGLEHAYFIATRFNDFCPSFWYINSWDIPCELHTSSGFENVDGCAVIMMDKDDEFVNLTYGGQ